MATKWGVVSAGKISNDFVAATQSIPGEEHKFVAIAARNLDSAKEFANKFNIPKSYGSYEELAKDKDIEVVYIGTIGSHHFSVGKLMLENGKHVLMEKPMTLNVKQTKALTEIAQKNKRFLMEAIWSRFFPVYKHMMKSIGSGEIGDLVHAEATFGIPLLHKERVMKKDMGGGTILDIGIYAINAVTMAFGGEKPKRIAAVGHLNEDGVDIAMSSSLSFSKNRTASITTSAIAQFPNDLVIVGTKGKIRVPIPFWCPVSIQVNDKVYEYPLEETIKPCNYMNSSGLRFEAMEVRDCLKKGALESSILPLKDSLTIAEIMDEIRSQIGFVFSED